jgi:hypothetical protein
MFQAGMLGCVPGAGEQPMSISTPEAPPRPVNDTPLRVVLEGRRGRPFEDALAVVCQNHGMRLGLAGTELPEWLAEAPRWARKSMERGHAQGMAMAARRAGAGGSPGAGT